MDRTIPYVGKNIMPDFLERNKSVLVASSENAIRGMLMYRAEGFLKNFYVVGWNSLL